LIFLALCLWPGAAKAITVSPLIIDYSVSPGESTTSAISLFNEGDAAINVSVSLETFRPQGTTGEAQIVPAAENNQAINWLKVPAGNMLIKSKEQVKFPITLSIPASAEPGGYYLAIMSEAKAAGSRPDQLSLMSRVGTLVFLNVKGEIKEDLQIDKFSLSAGKLLPSAYRSFNLLLTNQGNVHAQPQGFIIIRNWLGQTVMVLPVNQEAGRILPRSSRSWQISWPLKQNWSKKWWQGLGREWDNFYCGPYRAVAEISYGQTQKKQLSRTLDFWLWPVRTIVLIVLIIVIVILGKIFLFKRR